MDFTYAVQDTYMVSKWWLVVV